MKGRFLHIYLRPHSGVTEAQIEAKMNLALDWYRYDERVWLIFSTASLAKWKQRIKPLAGKSGFYFVCEINPMKRVGWMSKSFWAWLRKDRSQK